MIERFYKLFCILLLFPAGTALCVEEIEDVLEFNPLPQQLRGLEQQCIPRIVDSIYPRTQRNNMFGRIPQLNSLIQGALINVPELMQDMLYDPLSRELFSRVVVDYVNKKNLFNLGRSNLITQIQNEPDSVLPKKIKQIFVDNLQAKESCLDYAKTIADVTGVYEGIVPPVKQLFRSQPLRYVIINSFVQSCALSMMWDGLLIYCGRYEPQRRMLYDMRPFIAHSLFWVSGFLLVYQRQHYQELKDNNSYSPKLWKLLPYKYLMGCNVGMGCMWAIINKIHMHAWLDRIV